MGIEHQPFGPYERWVKRPLDCALASMALIALSPVLVGTAVAVRIKLGSPVIFKQPRPGLNERIFDVYKFRTMTDERYADGRLLPDAVRLTRFGRMLRSTSLDELPELFNIIKGDMAVVGPRPLMARYLTLYSEEERLRHSVRPGLTGLAQVHGRNGVNWDERMRLDVEYARSITFLGDVRIILGTVALVLKRDGVSNDDMENFDDYRAKHPHPAA